MSNKKPRWRILALGAFALNLVLATLLALSLSDEDPQQAPAEAPEEAAPLSWDDQSDSSFLYRSDFKQTMRQLWMNANTIVASGSGDTVPDYDEIVVSSRGIVRKANDMASFWQAVLDATRDGASAAPEGDWFGLAEAERRIWNSCNHCHREKWSMAYSHLDTEILEAWKREEPARLLANEIDPIVVPEVPNRKVMQRLSAAAERVRAAITERNVSEAQKGLSRIDQIATTRVELWRSLAHHATKIRKLAEAQDQTDMGRTYRNMRGVCVACHSANVAEERAILYPMPWPK